MDGDGIACLPLNIVNLIVKVGGRAQRSLKCGDEEQNQRNSYLLIETGNKALTFILGYNFGGPKFEHALYVSLIVAHIIPSFIATC